MNVKVIMRIFKETKTIKLPTEKQHLLFIQFCYGMVHKNALDSHRLRSMFSLNILEEINMLLSRKDRLPVDKSIMYCSEEALSILEKDEIINQYFQRILFQLIPYLEDVIKLTKKIEAEKNKANKKEDEKKLHETYLNVSYYLKDFLVSKDLYRKYLIKELGKTILKGNDEESEKKLFRFTRTLLSFMVHERHSLEYLFSLTKYILINPNQLEKTFEENLQYFFHLLTAADEDYEIYIKTDGWRKGGLIPEKINTVTFQNTIPILGKDIKGKEDKIKKYLLITSKTRYAKIDVKAKDHRSAGMIARDLLYDALDLLRFELEQKKIGVSDLFLSNLVGPKQARLFAFPSNIPNPNINIQVHEFERFSKSASSFFDNEQLDEESKTKVKSALRLYRTGRDEDNLENKFLNWWTAIEYLLRVNKSGSIVDDVEGHLVTILVYYYIPKHLEIFKSTFDFCKIQPSRQIIENYGKDDFKSIENKDLFSILKEETEFQQITEQLTKFPIINFYLRYFVDKIQNPESLKAFLEKHSRTLTWQIHRIYRVRCDIVHSAGYSLNLTLLTANLEFYLKTLLKTIIDQFSSNNAISSLRELFDRFDNSHKKMIDELAEGKEEHFKNMLSEIL